MAAVHEEELARACAAFAGEHLLELAEAVAAALGEAVPLRVDWGDVASAAAVARVGEFVGTELVPALTWLRSADRRLLLRRIERIDIRFAVSARGRVVRCINEALVIGLPPDARVPEWSAAMLCRLLELDLDAELAPVFAHVQSRVGSWQERGAGGAGVRWVVDWIGFTGHVDPRQTVVELQRLVAAVDRLGAALLDRGLQFAVVRLFAHEGSGSSWTRVGEVLECRLASDDVPGEQEALLTGLQART